MNKIPLINSTQRNSVNSSFSTVKNCEFSSFYDTANKHLQDKRFSYQEVQNYQQTSQKENRRNNCPISSQQQCLNHPSKTAMFLALEHSQDPMPLCERCAIMVASKGFQITKIQQKRMKKINVLNNDILQEINDLFISTKNKKQQAQDNLSIFASKLQKKLQFIDQYFQSLFQHLQKEKSSILFDIMSRRREIENLSQQSNNFYINQLEKIKNMSQQISMSHPSKMKDIGDEIKSIKKRSFDISFDTLKFPLKMRNIKEVCQDISSIIRVNGFKQVEIDKPFQLNCEQQNSQIRSLQLSFEEQNNFTLNGQDPIKTGDSSNLLSLELF